MAAGRAPPAQGGAEAVIATGLEKAFGDAQVLRGVDLAVAGRRARRPARPERLRQDHPAAHDRRARAARRGRGRASARGSSPGHGTFVPPGAPADRHGVPGRRPLPPPQRRPQRRLRPAPPRPRARARASRRRSPWSASTGLRRPRCPPRSPAASSSGWPWRARSRPRPSVLLLDEPFSNLDAAAAGRAAARGAPAARRASASPPSSSPTTRRRRSSSATRSRSCSDGRIVQQGAPADALRAARPPRGSPSSSATPTSSPASATGGAADTPLGPVPLHADALRAPSR